MSPKTLFFKKKILMIIRKCVSIVILVAFIGTSIKSPVYAQIVDPMPHIPVPGVMVHLSPEYTPAYLKGIVIHPENALKFDFIIYKGDKVLTDAQKRIEYTKLTKYFLASLAIPDDDQWVNLSPYEKDRIIKDDFGKTEMGRDLLAQDYLLKQVTASLIYPENNLGKKFWDRVYSEAQEQYGTSDIPVNTFNKVWILPDSALIYEKGNTAYVLKNHLKVMLEEDYLSLQRHSGIQSAPVNNKTHSIASKIVKQIILPELEREVNEGKNFAAVRQVYSGMLLAAWYKRALKASLLSRIYANKAKVKGVDQDPRTNEQIYRQYLRAYKKGVFNYIKEDVDKYTNETIPRKYFSGGGVGWRNEGSTSGPGADFNQTVKRIHVVNSDQAQIVQKDTINEDYVVTDVDEINTPILSEEDAMNAYPKNDAYDGIRVAINAVFDKARALISPVDKNKDLTKAIFERRYKSYSLLWNSLHHVLVDSGANRGVNRGVNRPKLLTKEEIIDIVSGKVIPPDAAMMVRPVNQGIREGVATKIKDAMRHGPVSGRLTYLKEGKNITIDVRNITLDQPKYPLFLMGEIKNSQNQTERITIPFSKIGSFTLNLDLPQLETLIRDKGYKAAYLFLGHGSKGQFKDVSEMERALDETVAELNKKHGRGKWLLVFGGDAANVEKPDLGYLVKRVKEKYSEIPILAVQADEYEKWGVGNHVDYVYYYPTQRDEDNKILYGGYDEGKNQLLGSSRYYLGDKFINSGLSGIVSFGGGEIARDEVNYALNKGIKVIAYKITPRITPPTGEEFGVLDAWLDKLPETQRENLQIRKAPDAAMKSEPNQTLLLVTPKESWTGIGVATLVMLGALLAGGNPAFNPVIKKDMDSIIQADNEARQKFKIGEYEAAAREFREAYNWTIELKKQEVRNGDKNLILKLNAAIDETRRDIISSINNDRAEKKLDEFKGRYDRGSPEEQGRVIGEAQSYLVSNSFTFKLSPKVIDDFTEFIKDHAMFNENEVVPQLDLIGFDALADLFKRKDPHMFPAVKRFIVILDEVLVRKNDHPVLPDTISDNDAQIAMDELSARRLIDLEKVPAGIRENFVPVINLIRRNEARLIRGDMAMEGEIKHTTKIDKYGGIDFNAANLNLQIKRDGNGVPLPISQQDLENIHIDGLIPVILDIKPAMNSPLLSELQLSN